jgi:hypothetical protein
MPGRHKCPPGLPGLGPIHLGSARDGRDADQMMAGGALDLPPRGVFAALDVLLAVGTGEFKLAHKPFRVDSARRCTTGRFGASRALRGGAATGLHDPREWTASRPGSQQFRRLADVLILRALRLVSARCEPGRLTVRSRACAEAFAEGHQPNTPFAFDKECDIILKRPSDKDRDQQFERTHSWHLLQPKT